MYLAGTEFYVYQSILDEGVWAEKKGDEYFNQQYYSDARGFYSSAVEAYEKAKTYAKEHSDYEREGIAERMANAARGKRLDAIDKYNQQNYRL